jgi:hypothetical protein
MRESIVWECFGVNGVFAELRSLAAYLGDASSREALAGAGIEIPTLDDFRCDDAYNMNLHGLDLPESHLETMLLVRTLAAWGAEPLVRAALACARLQAESGPILPSTFQATRSKALTAAARFVEDPSRQRRFEAERAAQACRDVYARFEDASDSAEATAVWLQLGAAWFAAESAAADYDLQGSESAGPPASSSTWGTRNSVWPQRAAEAAAEQCSHETVREAIAKSLIEWAVAQSGGAV